MIDACGTLPRKSLVEPSIDELVFSFLCFGGLGQPKIRIGGGGFSNTMYGYGDKFAKKLGKKKKKLLSKKAII